MCSCYNYSGIILDDYSQIIPEHDNSTILVSRSQTAIFFDIRTGFSRPNIEEKKAVWLRETTYDQRVTHLSKCFF